MMPQPDSQHLFLLLKRTVVMRIVWSYMWHPGGNVIAIFAQQPSLPSCLMDKEEFLIGQRRCYTDVLIIQVLSVAGIAYNIILKFCITNVTIFTEEKFVIGGLRLPLLDFFLCICLIAV